MPQITYTLTNPNASSEIAIGNVGILRKEKKSFTVEEDSPDDVAINLAISKGLANLISVVEVGQTYAPVPVYKNADGSFSAGGAAVQLGGAGFNSAAKAGDHRRFILGA